MFRTKPIVKVWCERHVEFVIFQLHDRAGDLYGADPGVEIAG